MSIGAVITLITSVFAVFALIAARAGIRSIQSARKVVFYRTRQARMATGWQWLITSFVLAVIATVIGVFGQPVTNRLFAPAPVPTVVSTSAPIATAPLLPQTADTDTPSATRTLAPTATLLETIAPPLSPAETATVQPTPSFTPTASLKYVLYFCLF